MNILSVINIFLLVGVASNLHGQSDSNLLSYRDSISYSESSSFFIKKEKGKKIVALKQCIYYSVPNTCDAGFHYELDLTFINWKKAKKRRVITLDKDTVLVKSEYGLWSVWMWPPKSGKVSGKIEIVKCDKKRIKIKENISVYDIYSKEKWKFIGTRTFKKKKGPIIRARYVQ